MADTLTTWTYTGTGSVSLTWTRDGKDVKVTDTEGNSYTYTIADDEHFTEMTLHKDGAAVEWPENTAYAVSGADRVELSGTIVTAATLTTELSVVIIKDGVAETVAQGTATNDGHTNFTIAGGGFDSPLPPITFEIVAAYDGGDMIYDYSETVTDYEITGLYCEFDGSREEIAPTGGAFTIYHPGIGTYSSIAIIVEMEILTSTFTLLHDTES